MSQLETTSSVMPLKVNSVVKKYGSLEALSGVSFEVRPSEVYGLLGPNGAGKTSLISIIVTLEKATKGSVEVFGCDVAKNSRNAKVHIGWVPQEIINHGFFDIEEILHFHAGYYGVKNPKERIHYLLNGLDLYAHRNKKVKQLSGGMKRRLMIAKALVHEPGLLLLDEPTAGVDVELRIKLWRFVEELKRDGLSILLTTHYLEEAELLCDRVAIIHKGKIQAEDRTKDLIAKWTRKKIVLRWQTKPPPIQHPDLVKTQGEEWTFLCDMGKTLGELLHELKTPVMQLRDVKIEDGSLEDVFVKLTQDENRGAAL